MFEPCKVEAMVNSTGKKKRYSLSGTTMLITARLLLTTSSAPRFTTSLPDFSMWTINSA